jgi:putative spermidine/putrescine transport system ATP-binding protein
MPFIELVNVSKSFGRTTVVRDLSLAVVKGEFVSLLGGSGCGKTTTLRMIAGFEEPSSGTVRIDGVDVAGVAAARRHLGMVFQSYALFPNMSVRRNIGFGLRIARKPSREIEKRVDAMLELIRMPELEHRYPHELSGGQQQRVALARAIAVEPGALLLDEPLSALDAKIRVHLREDIRAIQHELGITTVYVTHDQEEALSISDRIAVMRAGQIEQIGSPEEIYLRPATTFVASFIGTLNAIPAKTVDPAAGLAAVGETTLRTAGPIPAAAGEAIALEIRPEAVRFGEAGPNSVEGRVLRTRLLGPLLRLTIEVGGNPILVDRLNDPGALSPAAGERVVLRLPAEALRARPATSLPAEQSQAAPAAELR